jgi:AraC-like DNA-binding protein
MVWRLCRKTHLNQVPSEGATVTITYPERSTHSHSGTAGEFRGSAPSAPSTVQVAEARSFAEWNTLISESFVPLQASTDSPAGFRGRLRSRVLDELSVVEVTAHSHKVLRTPALITRSDRLYYKLNLQLSGTGILIQDNREAALRPGDLAVYDTHRPYTLEFDDDFRTLVLMFPHDALDLPTESVAELTAVRMAGDAGIGRMISPFMVQLADNLELLSGPSGHRLAHNAVDLLATLFDSELRSGDGPPQRGHHGELLARIRQHIEANLGDPELSPAAIAAAHFISTRHLHSIFHDAGTTVAGWIRARRLERCRRDLRDPLQADRAVGAIATRWGFTDAAHFSRVFRSAFGVPPSTYRRG